jgi:hypothetical protein
VGECTAVEVIIVPVIALFCACSEAVTTLETTDWGPLWFGGVALEACFYLAFVAAAVAVFEISIIAFLISDHNPISTNRVTKVIIRKLVVLTTIITTWALLISATIAWLMAFFTIGSLRIHVVIQWAYLVANTVWCMFIVVFSAFHTAPRSLRSAFITSFVAGFARVHFPFYDKPVLRWTLADTCRIKPNSIVAFIWWV